MLISEGTKNKLNEVLTHSFLLNMICDNLVYQIDYENYPQTAEIVHENFAHYWPAVADQWSNLMIEVNALPKRDNLIANYVDCEGDLIKIFEEIYKATEDYRQDIISLIELAELNEDQEIKLKAEEILVQIMPYRKQSDVWATIAKRYDGNYKAFDARFKSFTKMIPIAGAEDD